ncbi:AfsR/SARP family transcriptional regulator [Streptomyces buecherae]|uniref:AfsR/SARP family transcriptional regulator n=1 Tax=Streptomyces buecherae TaxID=2763006 RepID=UPI0037A259D6
MSDNSRPSLSRPRQYAGSHWGRTHDQTLRRRCLRVALSGSYGLHSGVFSTVDYPVHFHVLGPVGVSVHDSPVNLGSARQRAVLSALLLTPGHPMTAEQLTEAVWPHRAPSAAMANLHSYVSNLRRTLEPHRPPRSRDNVLRREATGYVLAADPQSIDAVRFEQLMREGRRLLTEGTPQQACRTLERALALRRGCAHPEVSDYSLGAQVAARFEELWLLALESYWEARLAEPGDISVIAAELSALSTRFPTRERFHLLLMSALCSAGRRAEAIDTYHRARRVLADEYGIDPGEELQRLFRRVLCGEPTSERRGSGLGSRASNVSVFPTR